MAQSQVSRSPPDPAGQVVAAVTSTALGDKQRVLLTLDGVGSADDAAQGLGALLGMLALLLGKAGERGGLLRGDSSAATASGAALGRLAGAARKPARARGGER